MNFGPLVSFLRPVLPRLVSLGVAVWVCCVPFFAYVGKLQAKAIEPPTSITKVQGQVNQQKLSPATNEISSGGAWTAFGGAPGCNDRIVDSTVMDNGDLVISGHFTACGDLSVPGLARWNGNNWSRFPALGSTQTTNYEKGAVAASGSNLYLYTVEQAFVGQNVFVGIARWNGTSWSAINARPTLGGGGTLGAITKIVSIGNELYVSGSFDAIEGVPAKNLARWDGVAWHSLGSTNAKSEIATMVAFNGSLHVGGNFASIGGVTINGIARWRNGAWESLGSGPANSLSGIVSSLAVLNDRLYVGGSFGVGGAIGKLAIWDGLQWEGVALPFFLEYAGSPVKLASSPGNLFVAFDRQSTWTIGRWDGSDWLNLEVTNPAAIMQESIGTMAATQEAFYISGSFSGVGFGAAYTYSRNIAKWSGNRWRSMGVGSGVTGPVYTVTVSGSDVYVGGSFPSIGGLPCNNIARWDGRQWYKLGDGVVGSILSIAVSGSDVYVAGEEYGSGPRSFVAKWDGQRWTPLFSNENWFGRVSELATYGSEIIAGGFFADIGGVPANNIARWTGSGWATLEGVASNGVNQLVNAITVVGNDVYVGGMFTSAGGLPANRIARWNSTGWSTLGDGIAPSSVPSYDSVHAIAVHQDKLIAAGQFQNATGEFRNNLAIWDGKTWTRRSTYGNDFVSSLASMSSDLYVGTARYGVSRQRGGVWQLLANGMRPTGVNAMATMDNKLFSGGRFQTVANSSMPMASSNFAMWSDLPDQLARMDFE